MIAMIDDVCRWLIMAVWCPLPSARTIRMRMSVLRQDDEQGSEPEVTAPAGGRI